MADRTSQMERLMGHYVGYFATHLIRLGADTGLFSALDAHPEGTKAAGLALARRMVEEDGAEVIILGCAAMAGYGDDIERELQVPVLDPLKVTLKVAEAFVDMGLKHSRVGLYAPPAPKEFK